MVMLLNLQRGNKENELLCNTLGESRGFFFAFAIKANLIDTGASFDNCTARAEQFSTLRLWQLHLQLHLTPL